MPSRAQHIARRTSQVMRRNSAKVVLRMILGGNGGPDAAPNPPRVDALVVDGPHAEGDMVLRLRGRALAGRIVAGDRFAIGEETVYAAADTATSDMDTASVPLTYGLAVPLGDGASVTPGWTAEISVNAQLMPFAQRLVDGQMIQMQDIQVVIAADDLPTPPQQQWRIIMPAGDERTVVNITPRWVDGVPVSFMLQVR